MTGTQLLRNRRVKDVDNQYVNMGRKLLKRFVTTAPTKSPGPVAPK